MYIILYVVWSCLVLVQTDDDRFSSVVVSASGKSDIDSTEHRAKKLKKIAISIPKFAWIYELQRLICTLYILFKKIFTFLKKVQTHCDTKEEQDDAIIGAPFKI